MEIAINDLQSEVLLPDGLIDELREVAEEALNREGVSEAELSVVLVSDEFIQDLNRTYRRVDAPTDVLSFPMHDEAGIGEIFISAERAKAQAEEYGHSAEREFCYLLVHGILHILGYDHDTPAETEKMRAREEAILTDLGITRDAE